MATVAMLAASGVIHRIDPQLEPDEQELRLIYGSDDVLSFLQNDLHALEAFSKEQTTTPAQDLDSLLAEYSAGLPMRMGKHIKAFERHAFHVLQGGIWYLRTNDLRIFGWFPRRDCFVAVYPETFAKIKGPVDLYEGRRNQVIHFRRQLDLDEPKFIPGDDPHAVLSNCIISK